MCSKFIGEHQCWSVISIKLQSNFIEIALRHGCSPVNLLHIFRTPFPQNTSGGLLLKKRSIIEIQVVVLKNWKQSFTDVLEKAFAMKISKISRYTLVSKSLISAYQRDLINFIEKKHTPAQVYHCRFCEMLQATPLLKNSIQLELSIWE